ncbi:hypothetical protein JOY44_25715 (plasmid) [Phormidium sp. CLA17]|uniref:hypothetical protein n=1 Tax=Leptolyngbya sp. Cla-17 TaxID=2803751 RepID=UPI0014914D24|nr:hypothetical protein [Leptolyngbya sp. Cla-17]MBM0744920.1 hypothetical protein [Leptolyngbya sp. Cla-17]
MSTRTSKDFHITLPIVEGQEIEQIARDRGAKPIHVIRNWIRLGKAAQEAGCQLLPDGSFGEKSAVSNASPSTSANFQPATPLMEKLMERVESMQEQVDDQRSHLNPLTHLSLLQKTQEACFVLLECVATDTASDTLKLKRKELIESLKLRLQQIEAETLAPR